MTNQSDSISRTMGLIRAKGPRIEPDCFFAAQNPSMHPDNALTFQESNGMGKALNAVNYATKFGIATVSGTDFVSSVEEFINTAEEFINTAEEFVDIVLQRRPGRGR